MNGVDDVKISLQRFGWPDYFVFLMMLLSCVFIGIYFGFVQKKPKKTADDADDYLVGGRKMSVFPITMSLIARYAPIQILCAYIVLLFNKNIFYIA